MKKLIFGSTALLIALFAFFSTGGTSCKKESQCDALITVLDTVGNPVVGATVKLDCNGCPPPQSGSTNTLQTDQQTTDASGRAAFAFKYEAVLDITVTHPTHLTATGILKLEAGKTTDKTITMQ